MPTITAPIKHRAYAKKEVLVRHELTGEEFVMGVETTDPRTGRTSKILVQDRKGTALFTWDTTLGPLPRKDFLAACEQARRV